MRSISWDVGANNFPQLSEDVVEASPGYSVLYQIPEGGTSKTTIYDREISYGQTVKFSQTTHNVAH